MIEGIGDDGDIEFGFFDIEYGEADAIDTDRAFFDDEVSEFFWELETEFAATVLFVAVDAGTDGVDMTLDDVTVETAVHTKASFEIDVMARPPSAEGAFLEGLFDGGDPVAIVADLFDRQTDAVMGEALVDGQFVRNRGFDPECSVGAGIVDGNDLPD